MKFFFKLFFKFFLTFFEIFSSNILKRILITFFRKKISENFGKISKKIPENFGKILTKIFPKKYPKCYTLNIFGNIITFFEKKNFFEIF